LQNWKLGCVLPKHHQILSYGAPVKLLPILGHAPAAIRASKKSLECEAPRKGMPRVKEGRMNVKRFFAEMKRRNVTTVAVAYAIVGWLLISGRDAIFPYLRVPELGSPKWCALDRVIAVTIAVVVRGGVRDDDGGI